MAYGEHGYCRCRAPRRADGTCPYACPPAWKNPRRKDSVGVREKFEPLISREQSSAGCKAAGTYKPWTSYPVTPKAAADARARRRAAR